MNNFKTFFLLLFSFILTLSSCKKCIVCTDRCYKCEAGQGKFDTLCNADFPTDQVFDTILKYNTNCVKITSSNQIEFCDKSNNIKTIQANYESKRYTCTDK